MSTGDIIFEQGEYCIMLYNMSSGEASFNGEIFKAKAYHFRLLKDSVPCKYYSTAVKFYNVPDWDGIKTEVIEAFKKFMV